MSVRERPLPSGVGPFAQGNLIEFCVALNVISSVVKSCVFYPILVFISSAKVSVEPELP